MIATLLPGLPPYGPPAEAFPPEWGEFGREGVVVKFEADTGSWVGNFRAGLGGLTRVEVHPNQIHVLVVASGDLWIVDPASRTAEVLLPAVSSLLPVRNPDGWVFDRQGIALARMGPQGLIWHTKRLSWDGFDELQICGGELTGLAWSHMDNQWYPFSVDLGTGRSKGGSFSKNDHEGWEHLCLP
jgi:hypothetical protein